MGIAEFEENSLQWILTHSGTVVGKITESSRALFALYGKTEEEFSAVRGELRRVQESVGEKLSRCQQARGECGSRLDACKASYDQSKKNSDSKEREAQNAESQREIERLQQNIGALDASISALREMSESLQRIEKELNSAKSEFDAKNAKNRTAMQRAVSDAERFYYAVDDATSKAKEILSFHEGIWSQWHGDRYKINRSGHEGFANGRLSPAFSDSAEGLSPRTEEASAMCVTLDAIDSEGFLARVDGLGEDVLSFRIPSYDFHKIGGARAMEELRRRGFEVKREGGSMIGNDGFITWEKRV